MYPPPVPPVDHYVREPVGRSGSAGTHKPPWRRFSGCLGSRHTRIRALEQRFTWRNRKINRPTYLNLRRSAPDTQFEHIDIRFRSLIWSNLCTCINQHDARGRTIGRLGAQGAAQLFLSDVEQVFPGAIANVRKTGHGVPAQLEHWPSNPLSLGSYTCYLPGQFTTIAGNESKPVGNIFFAGEHTNSFYEWQGFMAALILSERREPNFATEPAEHSGVY